MAAPNIPLANFPTVNADRHLANHPTIALIDKCSNPQHLKQIHAQMLRAGLFSDPFSASKLIQSCAFSHFSSVDYAHKVFDQIPQPNLYSWNALIRAYATRSQPLTCLSMFSRLLIHCAEKPNKFTYPFVIKALAKLRDLELGKGIHGMAIKEGFSSDLYVGNCLIHFYAKCGCLDLASRVFSNMPVRDVISWNSIIDGLANSGREDEAMEIFRTMDEEGVRPNDVTMVGVLTACRRMKADVKFAKMVHSYIEKNGIEQSLILCNAILDMYTRCGGVEEAKMFFDKMVEKDIISWTTMLVGYGSLGDFDAARGLFDSLPSKDIAAWNALISAYEQNGSPKEAVAVFNELQRSRTAKPDEVTLVSTLSACSELGAIELGGWIHVYIKKEGMRLNCHLATALIDMYSKCGDLEKALDIFHSIECAKDVFVWSAMIAGLGMHGCGLYAVEMFEKMLEDGVKPTAITFTNLLSACSHSGLVEEGRAFLDQMERVYNIQPGVEHYACMIDILGRAGLLEEAMALIKAMPVAPGASVWGALLGACRLHKNVELAEEAWARLHEIEPRNHGAYVLLSNVYANSGLWEKVSEVRKRMREVGLRKEPGCSSVEVNGSVHEFLVGDNTHPMSKKIYSKLGEIAERVKSEGYETKKSEVLQMVEEEEMQEKALSLHSERLALAYGLIALEQPSQRIRIVKNLRVCEDCHSVFKVVSKAYGREIVLRDRYRFHHFKEGSCSCNDYW
ncbi:pentatricopeptide repeat-containing protein, chloroplastic-like protein [Salvia divinorum]|uniref:Pentatricopeptide repeat-containing protein, chloroplastic-like protein n=1 Tax=Salvia divinorum TaxID=28513 RepID=A0ABD1GA17_SALDI